MSILQDISSWCFAGVFTVLPNAGVGLTEVQGGDGETGLKSHWQCQELGTLMHSLGWELEAQINSLGGDRTGRNQDFHLLKWRSICCSDSDRDSKFLHLFCLLQTPF